MFKYILDSLFPIKCLGACGTWDIWLCKKCQQKIVQPKKNILPHPTQITGIYYLTNYKNPLIQKTIQQFKYQYTQELAPLLSNLLNNMIDQHFDYIIPVPLHYKKYLERGFNQSELLTQNIKLPVLNNLLIRKKYTSAQAQLDEQARSENIKNSFQINPKQKHLIKNKTVLLLDDVYTTGATMQACAELLKQCQLKEIWGIVLAKGKN